MQDPSTPIEETVTAMKELVQEGKVGAGGQGRCRWVQEGKMGARGQGGC